ncbi:hypothetical protein BC937DRAFT_90141 [Endogone sp. FLAS-F59071]|nr:hypothetical protein BC937DRAFT_90141 [Endogone sp. FLAS-F59071]|eukprot:RUS22162.1 hypothetical protein BC937DRAFT_90141 [Endogone sp. FLAS-F59071]
MVYVFEAARRRTGESTAVVGFRVFIAVVLVLGVLAYGGFQCFLIWQNNQNGSLAVRLFSELHKNYLVPDIVFCSTSTNVTYTCTTADFNGNPNVTCQQFINTTLISNPDKSSYAQFPSCTVFKTRGNLTFNRWEGISEIDIQVLPPKNEPVDNVQIQLFDPSKELRYLVSQDIFSTGRRCNDNSEEDNEGLQEACQQNIYFMPNNTRFFTVFQSTIHEVLNNDVWATIGIYNTWYNESSISSSTEKEDWGTTSQFGLLTLRPSTYLVSVQQDQKIFTLLQGLGLLGGVYGVLAGVYIVLFGQPHFQPIGFVDTASRAMRTHQRLPHAIPRDLMTESNKVDALALQDRVNRLERMLNEYVIDIERLNEKLDQSA